VKRAKAEPDRKLTAVLDAAAFAARAHQGHLRKDGKTPYVSHVFRVCLVVRDLFGFDDPRMLMAALLHDTVEDTTTDLDDLIEKFGTEVADWVALLTKDKRQPEEKREAAYLKQLAGAPWQVQACKLADIYDNLTDLDTMPAAKQAKSLARMKSYLEGLEKAGGDELRRPLELAWQLWRERSAGRA
jgi:(p)ppGpp synthase/HD superfamily hydrolase